MKKSISSFNLHTLFFLLVFSGSANAAIVDLAMVPMILETDGYTLSFNADGVSVSTTGHHVTYDPADSSSTISAPVPISETGAGFGLVSTVARYPRPTDQAGFDNMNINTDAGPSFQFALFSFDSSVTVSQVILDSVSNYANHVWVAGGTTAPDLSQDFITAFSAFDFINSPDDPNADGDGPIHTFDPLDGISYLAVGASPNKYRMVDNVIPGVEYYFGPLLGTGNSNFYINELNVSAVPVPAAVWLFGSGLIALIGLARRKARC
jgi:hypothetical protein